MPALILHQNQLDRLTVATPEGKTLAVYNFGHDQKHAYFHPLYSPKSHEPITCFAPYDHPWHKGLWWSWKYINGCLFWEPNSEDGNTGDSLVVEHQARVAEDHRIEINQLIEMRTRKTGELLMTERRTLTLHQEIAGFESAWAIDWSSQFKAIVECELAVTPFPETKWGGYAGLNFRPNRTMGFDERIVNSHGDTGTDACHGKKATWAAYGGVVDGDPSVPANHNNRAGVAILDHPSNRPHPTPWYAWSSGENNRGFGFLAASPLMHQAMKLGAGKELHQRYRVVIFDGAIAADALNNAWKRWA